MKGNKSEELPFLELFWCGGVLATGQCPNVRHAEVAKVLEEHNKTRQENKVLKLNPSDILTKLDSTAEALVPPPALTNPFQAVLSDNFAPLGSAPIAVPLPTDCDISKLTQPLPKPLDQSSFWVKAPAILALVDRCIECNCVVAPSTASLSNFAQCMFDPVLVTQRAQPVL